MGSVTNVSQLDVQQPHLVWDGAMLKVLNVGSDASIHFATFQGQYVEVRSIE